MKFIINLTMTVLTMTAAGSAWGACLLGGSEHSVGDPSPTGAEGAALRAFNASAVVTGQDRFLRDHGFCVTGTTTAADDAGVAITRSYESRTDGSVKAISGDYRNKFGASTLFIDELAVDGLGRREVLDADGATLVLNALRDAGVRDPNRLLGAVTLDAASLSCSSAIVPNPRPRCEFVDGDRVIPVADDATAQGLDSLLETLGAVVNDGRLGASNKLVSLVHCQMAVVPHAVPRCAVVVAD